MAGHINEFLYNHASINVGHMPELPDLQVFSRNLQRQLAGKKLARITLSIRARINVPATRFKKALETARLSKVHREGKELRFVFVNKHVLGVHLMLRGKFTWAETDEEVKHTLARFDFGERILVLTDYQRNARLTLDPELSVVPDALSPQANLAFWRKLLANRSQVKNLLLDQKAVRGIGNAYADEILWEARISPFSIAQAIPPDAVRRFAQSVKKVLKRAEKAVARAEPGIIGGEVRDFLGVHNHKEKKSPGGAVIKAKTVGGRKTYFTSEQKLYK